MPALRKVFTAEDKKMRLSWWQILCVMVGTLLLVLLFAHFGISVLDARPTLYSAGVIGIAIAMRWKLRRHVWFWSIIAVIAALHVPLILYVPWTNKWVPAFMIAPIGLADLYAILWIVAVVGETLGGADDRGAA